MSILSLIAWNWNHGSLSTRIAELAECSTDVAFFQECLPAETLPLEGQFFTRRINAGKGIALGSLNPDYQLTELAHRAAGGAAVAAAMAPARTAVPARVWLSESFINGTPE